MANDVEDFPRLQARPYTRPTLRIFGGIVELTASGSKIIIETITGASTCAADLNKGRC